MKIKTYGYLALAMLIILASLTPILYRLGNQINTLQLSFLVTLVGTLVSFVYMLKMKTQGNLRSYISDRKKFSAFAIVGVYFAMATLIFSYTTHYITASLVAVVYRIWPLMFLLLAPILLREKISKWEVIAVALGFAGLAATLIGNTAISLPAGDLPFVALILFAALYGAVMTVVEKRYQYEIFSSTFLFNFVALVALTPFAIFMPSVVFASLGLPAIALILFMGTVQNFGVTYMSVTMIRSVKASLVASAQTMIPFITVFFGALLLGEAIQASYLVIAGIVLIALFIQRLAPKGTRYITKSEAAPTIYDISSAFVNTKNALIYGQLRNSGRVLAFSKSVPNEERVSEYADAARNLGSSEDNCVIFTGGESVQRQVSGDEMDFIKEMMGATERDVLVIGAGNPQKIEDRFAQINETLLKMD